MHVVITRPREDAEDLAAEIAARGHEPVVAPLLTIELISPADVDLVDALSGVQALALTSANGVRAASHLDLPRDLPLYAVGDATAEAAEAAGFQRVESAQGDAAALAGLIRRRLDPADGAVLHVSGETVAGRLAEDLGPAGFDVRRLVGYRARPVARLPQAIQNLLEGEPSSKTLKAIMIFSPRTAETFVRLVAQAGLADRCTSLEAVCLSPAVADRLRDLKLRGVRTAAKPERAAMLAALEAVCATPTPPPATGRGD